MRKDEGGRVNDDAARGPSLVTAFIALGSNLGDPQQQVRSGLLEIAALPATRLVRASSMYRSAAVGYRDQPDFVNAVAQVETRLAPRALLDRLLAIERGHGRVREFPNAPRTLDLDIILYGDLESQEPGLAIPHPRMHERAFVLVPLAEIAPQTAVPGRGRASELLKGVDTASVSRLGGAKT